jgi:hypothetical protein
MRPGPVRLLLGLGIAFFGLLYLVAITAMVVDGQVEVVPTVIAIEEAERGEFPDRSYLGITGGYVAFSESRVATTTEREFLYVVAPVVSQSIWRAWQSRLGKGVPLDARGVRLLVWFDGDAVAERWPDVARRLAAGEPLAWPVAKLDVEGKTRLASNTLGSKAQYENLEESLEWSQLRVLTYGDYHASLGGVASK